MMGSPSLALELFLWSLILVPREAWWDIREGGGGSPHPGPYPSRGHHVLCLVIGPYPSPM